MRIFINKKSIFYRKKIKAIGSQLLHFRLFLLVKSLDLHKNNQQQFEKIIALNKCSQVNTNVS